MSDQQIQVQSPTDPQPPVNPPAPEVHVVKSDRSGRMFALLVGGDGQTRLCSGTDAVHLKRRIISALVGEFRLPLEMAQGIADGMPELQAEKSRGSSEQPADRTHPASQPVGGQDEQPAQSPPAGDQSQQPASENDRNNANMETVAVTGPRVGDDQTPAEDDPAAGQLHSPHARRRQQQSAGDTSQMAWPAPQPDGQRHPPEDEADTQPGKEA